MKKTKKERAKLRSFAGLLVKSLVLRTYGVAGDDKA